MYLAYFDEADHTKKNSFTICGLTAFESAAAIKISNKVLELLEQTEGFSSTDILKSSSSTRPNGLKPKDHTQLKNKVLELANDDGINFFGYGKFNAKHEQHDAKKTNFLVLTRFLANLTTF